MIKHFEKNSMHGRIERLKQIKRRKKLIGAGVLLALLAGSAFATFAAMKNRNTDIMLEAKSTAVKLGEELPKLQVEVTTPTEQKKLKKKFLNKAKNYTVWDFINELKQGKWYDIECSCDGTAEGEYPINIQISKELKKKLKNEWDGRITMNVQDGTLTIQNPVGQWESDKFKRWDGTFVENDFVAVKGKAYYFDENGKKTTGWKDIGVNRYYFDQDGAMQTSKWVDGEKGKAYLLDDGRMATGWLDLGDDTYYFSQEGEMATGEKQIGTLKCVFTNKGKLKSKENHLDTEKPMMALTFDDGPGERTMELLDVLEKYHAHATFFMQGKNIPGREETVAKMEKIGCELGNHSYNHPQLTKLTPLEIRKQIGDTDNLVKQAAGKGTSTLRPPYGAINDTVKTSAGLPMILWNIDTRDWETLNKQATMDKVLTYADDGDIVLMHDIHSSSVDAAIELIPILIDKGYQLVTVSELAEARGVRLEAGKSYTDFNK